MQEEAFTAKLTSYVFVYISKEKPGLREQISHLRKKKKNGRDY